MTHPNHTEGLVERAGRFEELATYSAARGDYAVIPVWADNALREAKELIPLLATLASQVDNTPQVTERLRALRSQLAQFDFLLPGDYWKTIRPPTYRDWLGRSRPMQITIEMETWAGEIARARVLMDLDSILAALSATTQHRTGEEW